MTVSGPCAALMRSKACGHQAIDSSSVSHRGLALGPLSCMTANSGCNGWAKRLPAPSLSSQGGGEAAIHPLRTR
eukprot:8759138-Alexandrium_andersonii.AAC.1